MGCGRRPHPVAPAASAPCRRGWACSQDRSIWWFQAYLRASIALRASSTSSPHAGHQHEQASWGRCLPRCREPPVSNGLFGARFTRLLAQITVCHLDKLSKCRNSKPIISSPGGRPPRWWEVDNESWPRASRTQRSVAARVPMLQQTRAVQAVAAPCCG
jgi:hypothetical protein